MIDFDDLDGAEEEGDDEQKAMLVAANKDWVDRKEEEQRKKEEEERQKREALAARQRELRERRKSEEEEEQRKQEEQRRREELQRRKEEEELAKQQAEERKQAALAHRKGREPVKASPPAAPSLPSGSPAFAGSSGGAPKDLARGKPAHASSSKTAERGAHCAVDGDPQSRWTSVYADSQWLSVDLGELVKVSRVEVRWEAAHAASYVVEGSTDGLAWITLNSQAGSEGWVVTQLPANSPPVRWVRINCQKRATNFGFSIWELKVFGPDSGGGGFVLPGKPAQAQALPGVDGEDADGLELESYDAPLRRREEGAPERDAGAEAILAAVGRPYEVLGLQPGASSANIRRAYHALALKYHPDKAGDEEVFRAICSAYKALTEARDQDVETGWRDMEGQAVGPWTAHETGVNVVLFDNFGAPPWESRRLYTGCWGEAIVRCWELSKGEPGQVRPPPRLLGQIDVGGFINDMAAISPHGLVTAQSAGMIPQPGESMRVFDVNRTPFLRPPRGTAEAIEDASDADAGRLALEGGKAPGGAKGGSQLAVRQAQERDTEADRQAQQNTDREEASEKVFLHRRGCHALSLWPRPDSRDAAPVLMGSASKDALGVSGIAEGGSNVKVLWKKPDPHLADVNAICWDSWGKLWSGGNDGMVRLWDVASGAQEPVMKLTGGGGHVNRLEVWPDAGVMVSAHSSGITYLDTRAGEVFHHHYTTKQVKAMASLRPGHKTMFLGIGNDLNEYDTRMFVGGFEKPKAVGQWTLRAEVISLNCTTSARGHLLVACGCQDGKVAAFDTT